MVGPDPAHFFIFFIFFKKKNSKIFVCNFTFFPCIFYVILINIKQYFYVAKNTKSDIKIPGFSSKTSKIQKNLKKRKKCFYAYGQVSQKLKDHSVFFIHQKIMF